jgi:hypothetical protein
MDAKRIFAIALIVVGAIMLFFSHYIAERVAEGRLQIASGQRQVNTLDSAFSHSEYTKPVGGFITGGAQRKIDAGRADADQYESMAHKLQFGGVVLIIIGAGMLFIGRRRA